MRTIASAATALFVFVSTAGAQTVISDFGTPHVPQSFIIAGAGTTDMVGMRVTGYWDGGSTVQEFFWQYHSYAEGIYGAYNGSYLAFVGGGGLDDAIPGNFQIRNFRASPLERLVIDGLPAQTVFDRGFGGIAGTFGSGLGTDFVFTSPGPVGSIATYRNAVQLVGQEPVGDLFTTLDITFGASGLAWEDYVVSMNFDHDFAVTVPLTTVPEPASGVLVAAALAAVGIAVRRRSVHCRQ